MQDMDLYTGKSNGFFQPQFESADPEYFSRMADAANNDAARNHKRATRLIAFVSALCIVSFTAGLVLGIKFAGGTDKQLIDPHTREAVSSFGQKIGGQPVEAAEISKPVDVKNSYPKADFPLVIRIGNEYSKEKSVELANFLSSKGHTVVISRHEQNYRVYAGPFRTRETAEISLQKIRGYNDNRWQNNAVILKR